MKPRHDDGNGWRLGAGPYSKGYLKPKLQPGMAPHSRNAEKARKAGASTLVNKSKKGR